MVKEDKYPCRKCGKLNPISNDFCRRCGANLTVSTLAIKSQRAPVLPLVSEIRLQYVIFTSLAMLGLMAVLLGGFAGVIWTIFDISFDTKIQDLGSVSVELLALLIAAASLTILSFGLGGFGISWLVKRRPMVESMISATLVLLLFAVLGSTLSDDAPIVMAIMFLPSVIGAGVGSKLGEVFGEGKGK